MTKFGESRAKRNVGVLFILGAFVLLAVMAPQAHAQQGCNPVKTSLTTSSEATHAFGNGGETVDALGGNDTVHTLGGNDCVYGGEHADWINANEGDDQVYGQLQADTLYGGPGNDLLVGDDPGFRAPVANGLPQNIDLLSGGVGDDVLIGGWDVDEYYGGDGRDTCIVWNEGAKPLKTELGRINGCEKVVRQKQPAGVADAVPGPLTHTESFPPDQTNTVKCRGTNVATISGTDLDNYVHSPSGAHFVGGAGGWDRVDGFDGNDCVDGGEGVDAVFGGKGSDVVAGGSSFPDSDFLYGGEGVDNLRGGPGIDFLYGGGANDTLNGGAGADVCFGQADSSKGGEGDKYKGCETEFRE